MLSPMFNGDLGSTYDDANDSNTKAGAFLNDYISWRVSRIDKKFPIYKTLDSTPFLKSYISTPKTYYTNIKDKQFKLLENVLNYYQSDEGLSLMGISRPTLNTDLAEFVTDTYSKNLYTYYAKLSLLSSIDTKSREKNEPSYVNTHTIYTDFKKLGANSLIAKHSMIMAYLAVESESQGYLLSVRQADTFIPKLKKIILDEAFITEWVKTTIKEQQDNKDDKDYDNYRFNDLKFKLDLLDPTFSLSNEVLSQYYSRILTFYAASSIKDCKLTKDILLSTFKKKINEFEKQSSDVKVINLLKFIYGNDLNAFYSKLTQVIIYYVAKIQPGKVEYNANELFNLDSAFLVKTMKKGVNAVFQNELNGLLSNKKFYKFANALMVCAQASCIFYAIKNWDKLTGFKTELFNGTPSLSVIDIYNSAVDNKLFFKIGDVVAKWIKTTSWKNVEHGFKKVFTVKYFNKSAIFLSKFVAPVLVFVSICFTANGTWDNAQNQNWGILTYVPKVVIDDNTQWGNQSHKKIITSLDPKVFRGQIPYFSELETIYSNTVWAGPVSMIITGFQGMGIVFVNMAWGWTIHALENDQLHKFYVTCESQNLLIYKSLYLLGWLLKFISEEYPNGRITSDPRYNVPYFKVLVSQIDQLSKQNQPGEFIRSVYQKMVKEGLDYIKQHET